MARRPSRSTLSAAAAVLLGVSGAVLVGAAFTGASRVPSVESPAAPSVSSPSGDTTSADRPAPDRPAERSSTGRGTGRGVPDLVTGPVLARAEPVQVVVPRIGVTSALVDLGLDATGAMEVPEDAALAGWYTRGPAPGSLGPAVIAGHVSWDGVPGVFARLGEVRPGDRVRVSREDGTTAVFAVTRVVTYAKARFPTRAVFGSTDHAGLRLITCGGDYDLTGRRYLHNVVAFARLVRG